MRFGRTVAIRIKAPGVADTPAERQSFLDDARVSASLSHQNIAELTEIGDEDGVPFLVSEFVPGDTLRVVMGGLPMNPLHALDYAIQIADALAYAHSCGVAHLGLTPDTIVVTPKGSVKVLDFGLAAWTGGGGVRPTPLTSSRPIAYLSPEQAQGQTGDYRSDVFSLGTLLFEMLTGRVPLPASSSADQNSQILHEDAPAPRTLNSRLPPQLDRILSRMTIKNADDRWHSAAMVASELRAVLSMLEARAPGPAIAKKTPEGHTARWAIAVLIVVVVIAFVWYAASTG
jgi:serine/threonine-protein kinase